MSFKLAHLADLHFSIKQEKLDEMLRCGASALQSLRAEKPDLIVLAGDTVDEHDGAIRIDSDTARAAIQFVLACADIAPVAIVLGTPSHDRKTPALFRELRGNNPIYVADCIEMASLVEIDNGYDHSSTWPDGDYFFPLDADHHGGATKAVLTFLPSPDKARIIGTYGGTSKQLTTMAAKEVLQDALAYLGEVNDQVPPGIPRILVGHGMITGAEYSTGAVSTGEDLEYGIHDLNQTGTDYKAFGHVHKFQEFPGNIVYAGSLGRLNYGEQETKGFVMVEFEGNTVVQKRFIETPARRFLFLETAWENGGLAAIEAEIVRGLAECSGADVRLRYSIPEEERHSINRLEVADRFSNAGARIVKIEPNIIPKIRQRAAGISSIATLPEKIIKWGATVNVAIPPRVLQLATTIEGEDVPELMAKARSAVAAKHQFLETSLPTRQEEQAA